MTISPPEHERHVPESVQTTVSQETWNACLEAAAHHASHGHWGDRSLGTGWRVVPALALRDWHPPDRSVDPAWWTLTGLPEAQRSHPAAWLLRLRTLGEEVEQRERTAWTTRLYRADAGRDAEAAALWAGFLAGSPWTLRDSWDAAFARDAVRAFRAVGLARRLPSHRLDHAVADLREAWFYAMIGGSKETPGHRWLAARVLETTDAGPVTGVLATLPVTAIEQLTTCAAHRGGIRETVQHLFPERFEPLARARALQAWLEESPERGEVLLDLHTIRRVVRTWEKEGVGEPWSIAAQNRGRLRGRIRAVRAATTDRLLETLLSLDALHERTAAAVRRLAWAWAWDELSRDFAFDISRGLGTPCTQQSVAVAWSKAQLDALRAWVLLVVLRGRLGHLRTWVSKGSTHDRDSTWARLLSDALPVSLADEGSEGRARQYRALRTELAEHLDAILIGAKPQIEAIAAVPPKRGAKAKILGTLQPAWSEEVPLPASGFPTMIAAAARALEEL